MDPILTFVIGLLLRIGLPAIVTGIVFFLLRRLDEHWQKEALALPVISPRQPCWDIKGCSEENRKNCLAYSQSKIPCWQVFRSRNGGLREGCLDCDVFRLAPAPVPN